MAPPGVNTIFDPLDIMTFSSHFTPVLQPSKTTSVLSTLLSPLSRKGSVQGSSYALSAIHPDHDYVLKTHMSNQEYGLPTHSDYSRETVEYTNSTCGDAMLSSCAVDFEKVPAETTDVDFLIDLDDLNFNLDGLDPCCEVTMEDSFQDFIDSALEQSYPSTKDKTSTCSSQQSQASDAMIFNKEQFLAILDLRPTQENTNSDDNWSSSSIYLPPSSSISSNSLVDKTTTDLNCYRPSNFDAKDAFTNNVIPTRQCSCLKFESVFRAVYSTAHPPHQESVRICPSNLVTSKERSNNGECTIDKTLDIVMSPLFIDTTLNGFSKSVQSPDDTLEIMMEDDSHGRLDRETVDVMTWLSEGQQEDLQHYNNIDNVANRVCATHLSETSNNNSFFTPSLDLESFVDLDNFETESMDRKEEQQSDQDLIFPRTDIQSKNNNSYVDCMSRFKLSILTEHNNERNTIRHNSYTDSENSLQEKPSPVSSDLSYCDISPAWSRISSVHSLVSPLPLASMDLSMSSNLEDDTDNTSMKSPFALLNLFSDENATSLLHTESTVPNIRFI